MTRQKCNMPECYCHKLLTEQQKEALTKLTETTPVSYEQSDDEGIHADSNDYRDRYDNVND